MEGIKALMDWYASNCDGDWEHTFGVKIETSDNPGWIFEVNIIETDLEGKTVYEKSTENDDDWFIVKSDGETFKGLGDPTKLGFLLDKFSEFIKL